MMSSVLKLITCFHWPCLEWVNLNWCVHTGTYNQHRQTCLLIYISMLAHTCTNTHIFLMRLPLQTFIDAVNLTARAVLHSIRLCLIPIKPGLWTSKFSKPINLEGDKIQKQPSNNLFLHEKKQTKIKPTHLNLLVSLATWQHGCHKMLLTFVRFMCVGSTALPDRLKSVFLRQSN